MENQPSSYLNITAAEASEASAISYANIQSAVQHRYKITFMKLMWTASANTVLYSQRLDMLENTRQYLKKQTDSFSLGLAELQKVVPKNMSEELLQQRANTCKEMGESLKNAQLMLNAMGEDIIYYNDYNEDRQSKFRQRMSTYYQELEQIIEEKIEGVLSFLKDKGMNMNTSNPDEIRLLLKNTFNNPALQEIYIKAAGQIERQSLKDKLKGWFTS